MFKPKIDISQEKIEWLKNNYSILGSAKCSRIIGVSSSTCSRLAKRLELAVPNPERSLKAKNNAYKQFKIIREQRKEKSKHIFIDSPEKAYSLGFLWGDGNLSKANIKTNLYYVNLEILTEDYISILPFLNSLGQWKGYERKRNKKPTFCASLCDPILGLFLKNNDYDKKSLVDPCKILSAIPENLKHYWWRGYSDADGCFYVRPNKKIGVFTIVGNKNQEWKTLINILDTLKINYKNQQKNSKNGNCSIITIQNRNGIITFGNFLYGGDRNICLNRKYEKFKLINNIISP